MTCTVVDQLDDDAPTPPQGRYPTGQPIPQAWQGIGDVNARADTRGPKGTVYRARRGRPLRRLGWWVLIAALVLAALATPVVVALLQMLVL